MAPFLPPPALVARTVVITGGTSGIGHATALAFARRGWAVVLAARGAEALERVRAELVREGGRAVAVVCDVARYGDVERVVRAGEGAFGRIDVWVNNASVGEWSYFEDMPPDDIRRVVEVDLIGAMYGARAVLPHFRLHGGGLLINVASALADRAIPLLSTYVASKAAMKAWSVSLHLELTESRANVDVVVVLPSSIDTPFYRWGRSRMGVRPDPISVVYAPQRVAAAIVRAAERPKRVVYVGATGKALSIAQRISPRAVDFYMLQNRRLFREQQSETPDRGESNLYESVNETRIEGGYRKTAAGGSRRHTLAVAGSLLLLSTFARFLLKRRTP